MKVDIDNIVLRVSPITDTVFAGTLNINKSKWVHKKDVTNSFIDCVIKKWEGQIETVSDGNSTWEISVKKIK